MYIHLHRRLLERSEFRAVWNQDADSIQTSVEIDAHAVMIKLPPRGLRPSPCRGPGAGLGSRWQETWRRLNLQRDRRPSRSPRGGSHSSPISQELDGGRQVALVDLLDQLGGVPSKRTDPATPRLPVQINLEAWVMVIMERAGPE